MVPEEFQKAQAALETHIQEYFASRRGEYDYGEWFEPLYFDLCEYVGRKGKRVRPLMLMLSYRACGGTRPVDDPVVLRCAMALELLHSFVLVHDDVIDRSETRRGLPTFHKLAERRLDAYEGAARAGESIAIVMGDIIYSMSIAALQECELPSEMKGRVLDLFLRYATDTGAGEILDILFGFRDIDRLRPADIEKMYYLKTTRYTFEAPCVIGALLAGADEGKLDALRAITTPLGLAFQIQNDLLECRFESAEDLLASSDLLEGKKTLVIREAYERLNDVDKSFLQLCLSSARRTEATLVKLSDLIIKSGALPAMRARCAELFAQAESLAESEAFTPEERVSLRGMIDAVRRQVKVAA